MKKLLVVRNDKLGDFMLAWPAFALLKASLPDWHITALVPSYTASLAKVCPYIDAIIIDAGKKGDKSAQATTLAQIKHAQFDAVINFFSDSYNALLVYKAGIPLRMAPATKLIQILYTHRIKQRRSQSAKPEYEYNLDLARAFVEQQGQQVQEVTVPYLKFDLALIQQQRQKLVQQLAIHTAQPWIYVHAGSGGSANNLSLSQYARLIQGILRDCSAWIVLTAGPNEAQQAQQLRSMVNNPKVVCLDKNDGLMDFAASLACADIFIAGSTGPLHICGALDVPTIGFYPSKRSATPLRWQTMNQPSRRLAFTPPKGKATEDDLSHIDIEGILPDVRHFIRHQLMNKR